jgi:hypothetical protein
MFTLGFYRNVDKATLRLKHYELELNRGVTTKTGGWQLDFEHCLALRRNNR